MIKILSTVFFGALFYTICHIASVIGKCYLVHKVSSTNLPDEQVKSIAKMMSKDIIINIPK